MKARRDVGENLGMLFLVVVEAVREEAEVNMEERRARSSCGDGGCIVVVIRLIYFGSDNRQWSLDPLRSMHWM